MRVKRIINKLPKLLRSYSLKLNYSYTARDQNPALPCRVFCFNTSNRCPFHRAEDILRKVEDISQVMEDQLLIAEDIFSRTDDIFRKAEDICRRAEDVLRPRNTASALWKTASVLRGITSVWWEGASECPTTATLLRKAFPGCQAKSLACRNIEKSLLLKEVARIF